MTDLVHYGNEPTLVNIYYRFSFYMVKHVSVMSFAGFICKCSNVDGEQDPQIQMQEVILGGILLNFFRNLSYAPNLVCRT